MIKLTPLEWKQWKEYRDWVNDSEISRLIDRYLPVTETEHQEFYRSLIRDKSKIFFSVFELPWKRFVGICALKNIDLRNRKAELYICLNGKGAKGRGLGSETVKELLDYAFDRLNLNRVYLYTPSYNRAALSCYRKVGFVEEGEFLEDIYCDGKYHNSIRMCYLKRFHKKKISRKK